MVDMTLIRPLILNRGQGHLFWYQSISYATSSSYRLSAVTFAL